MSNTSENKKYEYFYFTHIDPCWSEMIGEDMTKEECHRTNGEDALLDNGMMFIPQDDLKDNERRIHMLGIREDLVGASEERLHDYVGDILHEELLQQYGIWTESGGAEFLTQEDFDLMMKDRKWVRTISEEILEGMRDE